MSELVVTDPIDTSRISFVLGINNNFYSDDENAINKNNIEFPTSYIANLILDYMHDHNFEDVSMTVTPVKGLYRMEYGCPENGENLYRMTSLYNPLHDQSKEKWRDTIVNYATMLSNYFNQTACTIIIENYSVEHPLQLIYIKNKDDNRRML